VYRCEVKSVGEFIRRVAVNLVPRGYVFYVLGEIPQGKDPAKTDAKIIQQYSIDISKWTRARHKRNGIARLHYLRLGRKFIILATHGRHQFFAAEALNIQDLRRTPLRFEIFLIRAKEGEMKVMK
jgi:hypothetical protein